MANRHLVEHDAITRTMDRYIAGARAGNGELMRPAFHPDATISGYCQGVEYSGSVEHVFERIMANGPAPNIEAGFARIEISRRLPWCSWKFSAGRAKSLGPTAALQTFLLSSKINGDFGRSRTNCSTGTSIKMPRPPLTRALALLGSFREACGTDQSSNQDRQVKLSKNGFGDSHTTSSWC